MRRLSSLLLGLGTVMVPALSQAQSQTANVNAEFFQPTPGKGFLGLRSAKLLADLQFKLEALFNYADDPVVVLNPSNDNIITKLVDSQLATDIMAAIGLGDKVEIGFALPVALSLTGEANGAINGGQAVSGQSFGDLRLSGKYLFVGDNKASDGLFVALTPEITLPTGDGEAFFGASSVSALLAATAEFRAGAVAVAGTAGVRLAQAPATLGNLEIGNTAEVGVAGSYSLSDRFQLLAEANSALSLEKFDNGQSPAEARLGARIQLTKNLWLPIGAGVGLIDGIGSPKFRILAGLSFMNAPAKDLDGDGILGAADMCPNEAEDKDGFEDSNGCPDLDNDKDGIADAADKCINDPEDKDSFQDEDGCADPDNDGDGVADASDKCPAETEDKDSFEDTDGCIDPDNDGDGLADVSDKCINQPEDKDSFEDTDGCPDPDNDKDGIADSADKCPVEGEDKDRFQDTDGCPEADNDGDKFADADDVCPDKPEDNKGKLEGCPEDTKAVRKGGKIFILDKVYFDVNKDKLQKRSFKILDAVADVLKENPDLKKIKVQGHTDDQGDDAFNKDLSQRRCDTVKKYLIEKGIEADRLVPEGFGEEKPLVDVTDLMKDKKKKKELTDAREQNRRVEFVIAEE